MPRECTVCAHPDRAEIDEALVGGASNRSVASLYDVSEAAVRRHKANHLPAKLVMAQAAEEVAQADDLLAQMQDLQRRTLAILEAAESTNQHRTALSAIREARGNLELLAKLLGELDERPVVNLNLSPEWLELRAVIVAALEPHPEALRAVRLGDGRRNLSDNRRSVWEYCCGGSHRWPWRSVRVVLVRAAAASSPRLA